MWQRSQAQGCLEWRDREEVVVEEEEEEGGGGRGMVGVGGRLDGKLDGRLDGRIDGRGKSVSKVGRERVGREKGVLVRVMLGWVDEGEGGRRVMVVGVGEEVLGVVAWRERDRSVAALRKAGLEGCLSLRWER